MSLCKVRSADEGNPEQRVVAIVEYETCTLTVYWSRFRFDDGCTVEGYHATAVCVAEGELQGGSSGCIPLLAYSDEEATRAGDLVGRTLARIWATRPPSKQSGSGVQPDRKNQPGSVSP